MRLCFPVILSFLLFACQKETDRSLSRAFYHWQTELDPSEAEKEWMDSLGISKLYIKFFDVDWDAESGQAVPLATVQIASDFRFSEIIPTVFITNRTMRSVPDPEVPALAARITGSIQAILRKHPLLEASGIQIDCDWSGQTREKYFRLLKAIRAELGSAMDLSATIRLHQVKYFRETGIPPVDRGMLMFYNVGEVADWDCENSILNQADAGAYLQNFREYPLELDLVLPIFSWGVLYRQGRMIRLINNLRPEALQDTSYFHEAANNRFEITKSTYLDGYYLYRGDLIRTESVSTSLLNWSARTLSPLLKTQNLTAGFYHLDSSTIKHYEYEELEAVFQELAQP